MWIILKFLLLSVDWSTGLKLNHVQSNLVTLILTFASNFFRCTTFFRLYFILCPLHRATQNSTHVSLSTTLNACGTLVNETEDELIFWNEIRVDAVIIDNVITRTHDISLRFYCSYSRKKMLSIQFRPQQIFIGSEGAFKILSYIYLHFTAYTIYSNHIYSLYHLT